MTIIATCTPLALPTEPGWRWLPQVYTEEAQLPLPGAPGAPISAPERGWPGTPEVVTRFAHLIVEALRGARRFSQLDPLFAPGALQALARCRGCARPGSLALASVHAQYPRPGAAEVTLRLAGARDIAVAFRLIRLGEHWRCTALEIG